jgi:hypothetical protein
LWPSMEQRLNLDGRHLVVTPDQSVGEVRRCAPGWVEVVAESKFLPPFPSGWEKFLLSLASKRTEFHPRVSMHGWWRQQLIKFAVADEFESSHYLCLDADLVVSPLADKAIAFEGDRSLWQTVDRNKTDASHNEHQPTWFTNAHRALGISDPGGGAVQVTPCFLASEGVLSLRRRLLERAPIEEYLVRLSHHHLRRDWMSSAVSLLPWTEFAMYCEWLRHTGEFERFHFHSEQNRVYGPSLWGYDTNDQWRAAIEECTYSYAFVVVQSVRKSDVHSDETLLRQAGII